MRGDCMSTELIVHHCAPTLAGLKIGNLFSCKYECIHDLSHKVSEKNKLLNDKGVYFVALKAQNGVALILAYRKKLLQNILNQKEVQKFLFQYGYEEYTISSCIAVLMNHLLDNDFPHEIGIFLGYPLEDIKEFIRQKGKNSKFVGYWKVYGDVHEAQKVFAKFKKCTGIYCEKLLQGFEITRLTVVG